METRLCSMHTGKEAIDGPDFLTRMFEGILGGAIVFCNPPVLLLKHSSLAYQPGVA